MALNPQSELTPAERERGLQLLVVEAGFSGGAAALTSGVILTAFALHLGASNVMVGLLAAMPFLAQLLQLPAIQLVERWRQRKRIAVLSSLIGRTMLAAMAALAFFSGTTALLIFLAAQMLLCGLGAIGGCAWNAWIRDLAPDDRLGEVFARRTVWLTAISLVLGLVAALALDRTSAGSPARDLVFAAMFATGCITGLISGRIVAMMPEPLMPPVTGRVGLRALLAQPLIGLHLVMGATIAGVTLASTNIALKLSPKGSATAYVAANAMTTAVAAGIAPILGGLLAQFFAARRFALVARWQSPNGVFTLPITLTAWDFYFLLAGLIGVYAIHRLSLVREQGEIERRAMVGQVLNETRRSIRNISSVAGLRAATDLPGTLLRDARTRIRLKRVQAARAARMH